MSRLLHAELIKLRTTRTFYALAGVAIGLSVLITTLVASLSEPTRESVLVDVYTNDASSLFIMILAIVGITGEWRHRTITSSLLAAPDRLRFLTAKLLAFAAAGLLLSLAIAVATGIVGTAILEGRDLPTPELGEWLETDRPQRRGRGAAWRLRDRRRVARSQPADRDRRDPDPRVRDRARRRGAGARGRALRADGRAPTAIQGLDPEDVGLDDLALLAPGVAVLAMLAWIAATFAAGAALLRTRDVE